MKHLSQEQIVLHCYGDAKDGEALEGHLRECSQCRAEFQQVKALLAEIPTTAVPEPPGYLEQKLWLNLRDRLQMERISVWRRLLPSSPLAMGAVVALLVVAAFLAGRFWPGSHENPKTPELARANPQRVVLVAVGDHLERSQMLLVEIMNADSPDADQFSSQQKLARSLLEDNHLYRISAQQTGNPGVANVLEELGRVLTEIANAPPDSSNADMQEIRHRIQSQDLLFKIHVVGTSVNRPEEAVTSPAHQRL